MIVRFIKGYKILAEVAATESDSFAKYYYCAEVAPTKLFVLFIAGTIERLLLQNKYACHDEVSLTGSQLALIIDAALRFEEFRELSNSFKDDLK